MGNSCCSSSDRKDHAADDGKAKRLISTVTSLRMYYEEHKEAMQMDVRRLYELQLQSTNLLEFRIIRKPLNLQAAEDLAVLIPGFSNLTDVSLVWTSMDGDSCAMVVEALKHASALENLCLNGNNIGDRGTLALSASLSSLHRLRKLHLDGNSISDKGGEALAKALPQAESMTFLSLQSNKISKKCQLELIIAADAHPAMIEIQLQSNLARVTLPPLTHVKVNADLVTS